MACSQFLHICLCSHWEINLMLVKCQHPTKLQIFYNILCLNEKRTWDIGEEIQWLGGIIKKRGVANDSGLDKSRTCVPNVLKIKNLTNWQTWLFFDKYAHKSIFSVSWMREASLKLDSHLPKKFVLFAWLKVL